jgi:hypothetical protein
VCRQVALAQICRYEVVLTPLLYDPAVMITKDDGIVETQLFHVAGFTIRHISNV